jgi:hypothetical protein
MHIMVSQEEQEITEKNYETEGGFRLVMLPGEVVTAGPLVSEEVGGAGEGGGGGGLFSLHHGFCNWVFDIKLWF